MITLVLTESEVNSIRLALRKQESDFLRNDFKALLRESQDLRSKIADAIINHNQATPAV